MEAPSAFQHSHGGGASTSAFDVPSDKGIAIVLTQTELGGPTGAPILETFWTAEAAQLGHHS